MGTPQPVRRLGHLLGALLAVLGSVVAGTLTLAAIVLLLPVVIAKEIYYRLTNRI